LLQRDQPDYLADVDGQGQTEVEGQITRNIAVKAKQESPGEIAKLMAMKPKWSRNDGI